MTKLSSFVGKSYVAPMMKSMILLLQLLLLLLVPVAMGGSDYFTKQDASTTASCATTAAAGSWDELFKIGSINLATTLETWIRAFSFGFGSHMLVYIFRNPNVTYEDIQVRFRVSMVCGVAMGCFVFGLSLMIPSYLRQQWFDYDTYPHIKRQY